MCNARKVLAATQVHCTVARDASQARGRELHRCADVGWSLRSFAASPGIGRKRSQRAQRGKALPSELEKSKFGHQKAEAGKAEGGRGGLAQNTSGAGKQV